MKPDVLEHNVRLLLRRGRTSPLLSYMRSVCGCIPTSSAAIEIM